MKQAQAVKWLILAAAAAATLGLEGCANQNAEEDLPMTTIVGLQRDGTIQPFSKLNLDVIARHPGSEVVHAALDKEGERWLYQASLVDPNKMQWHVELDAKTGEAVTDRQE